MCGIQWAVTRMVFYMFSDGDLNVFNVERNDDGSWLNGNNGHPDNRRNADSRFVFALPRKSFHFSPNFYWGSFVFLPALSNHQAFFLFHPIFLKSLYIFII